jgi:hypothetical protein
MSELTSAQTAEEFYAIMQREFSSRQLILACKATKCWWDVLNAITYPAINRLTKTKEWHQRQRCARCGSTRVARYAPRLPLTRLSKSYRYERPPGWYDERIYWSEAHVELTKDLKKGGLFKISDEPLPVGETLPVLAS